MALKQIKGNTFYSAGSTNIGICGDVMIDTDIDPIHIKALLADIQAGGIRIGTLLNTHAHPDHFGGNAYISKKVGAKICATKKQQMFMEEPRLLELVTYCAKAPSFESDYSVRSIPECYADEIISDESITRATGEFTFTPLQGHAWHQHGILTPDGVFFAGDVVMSEEHIEKYKLPVIVDVEQALADIRFLMQEKYGYYIFSHVPFSKSYRSLLERNLSLYQEIGERLLNLCTKPMGREELTGALSMEMKLWESYIQFGHANITVGAYITWLGAQNQLEYLHEGGIMKVVKK